MRRIFVALAVMLSMAVPAMAVDFEFHGDFNHRFRMYTNQASFFNGAGQTYDRGIISDDTNNDTMGELKYRLWTTAASDDGAIKGVFAVEVGGIQFGDSTSSKKGSFSGDGVNIETRWAYTDFAIAGGRARIGLMPINVNKFLWNETVTGVDYKVAVGAGDLTLAWYRGWEVYDTDNSFQDLDALYVRYDLKPADGTKVGFFALWQTSDGVTATDTETKNKTVNVYDNDDVETDADDGLTNEEEYAAVTDALDDAGVLLSETWDDGGFDVNGDYVVQAYSYTDYVDAPTNNYAKTFGGVDLDLYTLGIDGSTKSGAFFANWDLMYQFGDLMEEYDFGGYFAHVDVGAKVGKGKLTYTFWYASGDDDSSDSDADAFVSTDVDINSQYSVVLFEGYTDDDYFSETPYIQDKGLIMNRIGFDFQATDKLKVGVAALYLMTAEDIEYIDDNGDLQKEDSIGFEFDAYASYKLFSNTEAAIQFGYLAAGDAMDYYEVECDGSSDEDIFIISSRIRYKF